MVCLSVQNFKCSGSAIDTDTIGIPEFGKKQACKQRDIQFIHTSAARHPHLLVPAIIIKVAESRRHGDRDSVMIYACWGAHMVYESSPSEKRHNKCYCSGL
jgi:hypothetical protein